MKKSIVVASIVLLALVSVPQRAAAGSAFDLFSGAFGIWTAATGDNPLPVGSVVQLIWSADQTYHSPVEGTFDATGYLAAGDYILFQGNSADFLNDQGGVPPFSNGGGWSGDLDGGAVYQNTAVGGNVIQNGYVYARVFNALNLASAGAGTAFAQTGFIDVTHDSTDAQSLPNEVTFNGVNGIYNDTALDAFDGGAVLDQTVLAVPEPSVFAFLGVGAVVLGLRRRMARS